MKKRNIYLIIGIILTVTIVIMLTTYAMYQWNSSTTTDVSLTVDGIRILYKKGPDIYGRTIVPILDKEEAIIKEIEVTLNKSGDLIPTNNFYLDIIKLDEGLKDITFVWEFYKNDELLNSNNFSLVNQGSTLNLTEDQEVSTTTDIYTLYLWIDGNMSNPNTMQSQNYHFVLRADGYHA